MERGLSLWDIRYVGFYRVFTLTLRDAGQQLSQYLTFTFIVNIYLFLLTFFIYFLIITLILNLCFEIYGMNE